MGQLPVGNRPSYPDPLLEKNRLVVCPRGELELLGEFFERKLAEKQNGITTSTNTIRKRVGNGIPIGCFKFGGELLKRR